MSKISIGQKCNKFVDIFDIAGGGEHKGQGGEGAGRGRLAVCGESFPLFCLNHFSYNNKLETFEDAL